MDKYFWYFLIIGLLILINYTSEKFEEEDEEEDGGKSDFSELDENVFRMTMVIGGLLLTIIMGWYFLVFQ